MSYYLSFQYSAIQKTVLRHDRLWSIAGISQILSYMNEIEMRKITEDHGGTVIIAGGGKYTARFDSEENAEKAKKEIIELISTRLPMLEFQISSVVQANSFKEAGEKKLGENPYPGIIHELNEKKRCFRGYGVTFNPHFAVCEECEEYPAEKGLYGPENKRLCRICYDAREARKISIQNPEEESNLTSMEEIYKNYVKPLSIRGLHIPSLMNEMFPKDGEKEEIGRIAVWMSDMNSMNDMISLWLRQEEKEILSTFDSLKRLFIDAISETLKSVFPEDSIVKRDGEFFIPFRLIVAGGDDLCIVMPDKYILDFVKAYSSEIKKRTDEQKLKEYHFALTRAWLEEEAEKAKKEAEKENKPVKKEYHYSGISFGGSFIVTSIHAPFTRIHALGEELMSEAKKVTERKGNSVNWRVLSTDEESSSDEILRAEKPLFVEESLHGKTLSFNKYMELCDEYGTMSGSRVHQIVNKIIEFHQDPEKLKTWLLTLPEASNTGSPVQRMLLDDNLKDQDGRLNIPRLVTLFELISLKKGSE